MRYLATLFLVSISAPTIACSGDAGGSGGAGTSSSSQSASSATTSTSTGTATATSTTGAGGMTAFALTSSGFTEGTAIPKKYACPSDISPDLAWTTPPSPASSFAIVLTDESNNLNHWVIWDIPAASVSLPEGVQQVANPPSPAGSKQAKSFDGVTFGYRGPCPPSQHTYRFEVYAETVTTLPNVTTASTIPAVIAELDKAKIATATLTGTYTP